MLVAYCYLALRDFKKDKIAYVLDSSLAHSRTVALQSKTELDNLDNHIQFLTRGYDYNSKQFHPYTRSIFMSEKTAEGIFGIHFDSSSQSYKVFSEIRKPITDPNLTSKLQLELEAISAKAVSSEITYALYLNNIIGC